MHPFLQSISVVNSYRIPNLSKSGSAASAIHNQNNLRQSNVQDTVPKDDIGPQGMLQIDHAQHATFDDSRRACRKSQGSVISGNFEQRCLLRPDFIAPNESVPINRLDIGRVCVGGKSDSEWYQFIALSVSDFCVTSEKEKERK